MWFLTFKHCIYYIFILTLLGGCQLGKVGEVDTDEDDPAETPPSSKPAPEETTPKISFSDYSVNQSSISWDKENNILTLTSDGGTNAKGGFQGSGKGNKPIAGLIGFHNSDLRDFKVDFTFQGSVTPWMNFLIDINDDEIADYIFVPIMNVAGNDIGWNGLTDPFKVVCMPTCGTWGSNSYTLADFPNSKIVDSVINDGGMPKDATNTPMEGVLFSAGGGSSETGTFSVEIQNIQSVD
ncbi:hypothetical protein N9N67_09505 [Bacteriovoracaceae bacterium]|nr:hypothetical protein [Bacteriovoracaceae bacterium]